MRLRFLKPVNGWSGFLTELAIVVLGVLIALGAQQLVDDWQGRSDVAALRKALDAELADNLDSYQSRIDQSACLAKRLDQLAQWHRAWQDGTGPAIEGEIGRPLASALRFSVWRTGASTIATRMPLKERLGYANLYDAFESYDGLRAREVAAWQGLYAFDGAVRLTPQEVNALRGLILSARSTDRSMRANFPGTRAIFTDLGIKPLPPGKGTALDNGLCRPLRFAA